MWCGNATQLPHYAYVTALLHCAQHQQLTSTGAPLMRKFSYTVLSRASAHPPILTVLWFFEVLHVTAHHAKFLCSESEGSPLSSHSCDCSDALWTPQHQASKIPTHLSMASFAVFFPCSKKFAYCKRRLNAAET